MRLGLVTHQGMGGLSDDDQMLLDPLASLGIQGVPVAWDDPDDVWRSCDALVLRSTWNYYRRPAAFVDWLRRIQSQRVPMFNPIETVIWNMDKRYLEDVAGWGFVIPQTHFIEHGGGVESGLVWPRGPIIIKPVLSASAWETYRFSPEQRDRARRRLETLLGHSGAMVQAFLPGIREGEWSFVFIAEGFSHCVLKRPASGEFRVQHEYGGSVTPMDPPSHLLREACELRRKLPKGLLYTRIDGVEVSGRLVILEVELIEPELFFRCGNGSAARFARGIQSLLGRC